MLTDPTVYASPADEQFLWSSLCHRKVPISYPGMWQNQIQCEPKLWIQIRSTWFIITFSVNLSIWFFFPPPKVNHPSFNQFDDCTKQCGSKFHPVYSLNWAWFTVMVKWGQRIYNTWKNDMINAFHVHTVFLTYVTLTMLMGFLDKWKLV